MDVGNPGSELLWVLLRKAIIFVVWIGFYFGVLCCVLWGVGFARDRVSGWIVSGES